MRKSIRILSAIGLTLAAIASIGGTCVVIEEGPPGSLGGPGENMETMEEQEEEVMTESDR